MIEHCDNYDAGYAGCRECPGKVLVTQPDGTVDTICRAGEKAIRELTALPVLQYEHGPRNRIQDSRDAA